VGKQTTITVDLSPEIYIALTSLCAFYHKDPAAVIEMAIEQLAVDAKLITDTIDAKKRGEEEEARPA
jgi:predicted transcriptional regulator